MPKEFQVSIRSYSVAEFLHFFTKIPSHSCGELPHSSASNAACHHCAILVTMNNVSKSSNALLSTHSSSTSSENDTLQAPQDDSEEQVIINDDDIQDENVTKLSEYHAKNYFNSTMGGKDVWVLFAMAIGCNTRNLPSDKDPPFSKSKVYHTEIKPDAATLKLEITQRWKAYHFSGRQPHPANWNIEKCNQFLMANPIPPSEKFDLDWLESELEEWKGIQKLINESQEREDDRVIHRSWSSDVPFLCLYHTLVDDSIRSAFGKAYAAKTREELDGRNSSLFQSFYEKASNHFNDPNWIPHSLVSPDLHEDYTKSRPLPLKVAPLTPKEFQKKLNDNRYKMVKVISDWERSGSGRGMLNNLDDHNDEKQSKQQVYEFVDGDDRKSFIRERPAHVLYLWHLAYKYDILHTVRQQLRSWSSIDGDAGPSVDTAHSMKRKHSPGSNDPSLITNGLSDNIQQIADSINGLVGVARLSHETQQMNMLHLRRKQLEDCITKLDESCMDLELKCIDSSGSRKKLFQKALKKKQTEMEVKKKN